MSLRPRAAIARLKACPHGGVNYAELKAEGYSADGVLDFSVSSNPFMPPPGIKETLKDIVIEQYPDSEATELRQKLSASLGMPLESIVAGSGTTELIRLIALAYFKRGDRVLILEPTYGEYEPACRIVGVRVIKQWAREEDNFRPEMGKTIDLIEKHHPGGIFICNPNNPTGQYFSRCDIERIMDALGGGLLILDEAYIAFVEKSWNSIDLMARGNVIIMRSMTKDYGLPGLRLGYALAPREIADNLRRVCPPWNVNIVAQKVGVAVLEDVTYLEQTKIKVREARQFLVGELSRLGYRVLSSEANYFLVKVGNAEKFRAALLKQGILVRKGTSFGLPEYIRIAPRTMPECERLIAAIESTWHRSKKRNILKTE